MLTEDTSLLLTLVAVISGAVVIMAVLLIVLHCRRLRVRTKGLGDKVTEAAETFTEQEIWPGHEAGEGDMAASELKVSALWESYGDQTDTRLKIISSLYGTILSFFLV